MKRKSRRRISYTYPDTFLFPPHWRRETTRKQQPQQSKEENRTVYLFPPARPDHPSGQHVWRRLSVSISVYQR
ncbi:hypothetical protein E2C01_092233 [Portunus trituberculatus]|uniref:Uncharacterized protein n=1 Tax=Portunus trituberculatus TaxID=210409 RepID=A0A5B7JJK3_PORTR|nr:hypothetical protein [Portunus trituberculatus]